jgi:hypothetical protein
MIDLCTLEDVKLLMESVTNDFDADLESRITTVSENLQTALNIDLELQSYVELHCGGGKYLHPRNPPIISITNIIHSSSFEFGTGLTIDVRDYVISNSGWDITHVTWWPGGPDTIQVTYISGFASATTVPAPIRQAVSKQVLFEFQHRKSTGLTSVELADGTIVKDENDLFLKSVNQIKKLYRKLKIG